jgi:release factor glutamine methyltransferase
MATATRRQALSDATDQLAAAGLRSARFDAESLLAHVLGSTRSRLVLIEDVTEDQQASYQLLLDGRAAGVPLQHLTGRAPFRHLDLAVGPGVFIPRPETELLIDLVGDALRGRHLVVDLGAGSGAIALAVAHEFRHARVVAVEASQQALVWLRRNADERAAAGDRPIEVIDGNLADAHLLDELNGLVDAVLSNPPYVPDGLRGDLGREVGHDPDSALFAGPDGLALMPGLLATAARLTRPGGLLAVEHDESHAEQLLDLVRGTGRWRHAAGHADLTGRPRFVTAERLG